MNSACWMGAVVAAHVLAQGDAIPTDRPIGTGDIELGRAVVIAVAIMLHAILSPA